MNPIHFKSHTGDRPGHDDVTLCTDLLLTGNPWNQSFISTKPTHWDRGYSNCDGNLEKNCSVVGQLGSDSPVYGVTYTGNTHDPPSTAAAPSCTSYAAITAAAVVGLTATGNTMTDVLPGMPSQNGVLLRTGTDSSQWLAADINLIGNPNVPPYENPHENYGWWPLFQLQPVANRSLSSGLPSGELPFHTFFSPEIPQRNFYFREPWRSLDVSGKPVSLTSKPHGGYDGLESVTWHAISGQQSVLVASFDLSEMPSLAGQAIYFALRWKPAANGSALSLRIDDGTGVWQSSNASGLVCNSHAVAGCHESDADAAVAGQWRLRVFGATLQLQGTARFALRLTGASGGDTKISGIVVAPIGARYSHVAALKVDDTDGHHRPRRFKSKDSWKHAMSWRSSSADKAPSTTAPAPSAGRLNAKDFGAVGDGQADDTAALQRAVDAAQTQGKALYVPGGSYALSRPLLVHCSNEFCTTGFSTNTTYKGLSMSGAGEFLTTLFASASAPRLESILHFESHKTSKDDPNAQPAFNTSVQHQIADIALSGGATEGWQRSISAWCSGSGATDSPQHCGANYGVLGPGLTWTLLQRISISFVRLAAIRLYYCWYNRIEDCNLRQSQIGLHSACNNMRITGTNIDMMDLTGIMIDGGAATDIVGNLIEGNSGPAITLSAGIWGAPEGIVISSNYYEANNLYPVTVESYDGPLLLCTDLLLLGEPHRPWSLAQQELIDRPVGSELPDTRHFVR
eukprot:COSAG04_NODE_745_length_10645_cov_3.473639_7_plen_740_part_00